MSWWHSTFVPVSSKTPTEHYFQLQPLCTTVNTRYCWQLIAKGQTGSKQIVDCLYIRNLKQISVWSAKQIQRISDCLLKKNN